MVEMLSPQDQLGIRNELGIARPVYRETLVVIPTITSGSNYEAFTDSAYDITGAQAGRYTATFTTYRMYARVKIVKDTTLLGMTQVVTGFEVGDYLLYFRDDDKAVLDLLISNKDAYLVIDKIEMRPYNDTLNGVAGTMDVFIHAKKYSPKYKPDAPAGWIVGASAVGMAYVN